MGVGVAAFALYLALTPGATGDGDSGEFTLALAIGGAPHPPGYPLYALLGHLWVNALHAAGVGWAWAANSFSALGAATAVGWIHALAARLMQTRSPLPPRTLAGMALIPAALFGVHPAWLEQATRAEVYGWHIALLSAMAVLALSLLQEVADRPPQTPTAWRLFGFGLLAGAGLAHHPTSALFSLPLTASILLATRRANLLSPRRGAALLAGLLLPLAAHLFTVYRAFHPAAYQWPLLEPNARSVVRHLGGSLFGAWLGGFAPGPEQARILSHAVYPALVPGLAALAIGPLVARGSGRRWLIGSLLTGAALQLAFVLSYGVPDCVPYFLPLLFAAAAGLAIAIGAVARRAAPAVLLPAGAAVAAAVVLGALGAVSANQRLAARDAAIHARWHSIPFHHGIVLWQDDRFTRLVARQILERERPGLDVVNPAMLTWPGPRRAFAARHGFDPLAGLVLRDDSDLPRIAPNIARQTRLPVLDFAAWRP